MILTDNKVEGAGELARVLSKTVDWFKKMYNI